MKIHEKYEKNPFTLSFGKSPKEYISRIEQTDTVLETFMSDEPSSQIFMLTGVRGSGKTVMMTELAASLQEGSDQWVVLNLNPERDILNAMAAKLYDNSGFNALFIKAKIDLSILGIGLTVEGAAPVSDIEVALERMLDVVKKKHKRVLVTLDEVTNNDYIRVFAGTFQILIREKYPLFLLMTGLYENIYRLQNEKSLTFLYRAPRIDMSPLDRGAVTNSFARIFQIDIWKAKVLSDLTKGYPFAYQVLGYLCWEHGCPSDPSEIMDEYDQRLSEYVYSKIWSELSEKDREVVVCIAQGCTKVSEIMDNVNMTKSVFSQYRSRLMRKGIVYAPSRGVLNFELPRFSQFVLLQ